MTGEAECKMQHTNLDTKTQWQLSRSLALPATCPLLRRCSYAPKAPRDTGAACTIIHVQHINTFIYCII